MISFIQQLANTRYIWPFLLILLLCIIVAVAAPWLAPLEPSEQNLLGRLRAPGSTLRGHTYWLGSDELGRDLLTRLIYGARISLFIAFVSVCVSTLLGTWLGMVAGFYRGWLEIVIMRFVDMVLSIPALLLAILSVAVLGPGLLNLILVLGFTRWPRYARVAYGQTLAVANTSYVQASHYIGASNTRLLRRHILPNIAAPLIVVATLEFGLMILFEAGLSFLGLGVQPPTPSWGSIMSVGRNYLSSAWWIAAVPGLCLLLLVLSVNLVGDFLRDHFDPRHSQS